jgi:hypothetical protein
MFMLNVYSIDFFVLYQIRIPTIGINPNSSNLIKLEKLKLIDRISNWKCLFLIGFNLIWNVHFLSKDNLTISKFNNSSMTFINNVVIR